MNRGGRFIALADAFDRGNQCFLRFSTSTSLLHLAIYEVLRGSEHAEQDSRLAHIVCVLQRASRKWPLRNGANPPLFQSIH